jgi:hypothetical protein
LSLFTIASELRISRLPHIALEPMDEAVVHSEHPAADGSEAETLIEPVSTRVAGKRIDEDGLRNRRDGPGGNLRGTGRRVPGNFVTTTARRKLRHLPVRGTPRADAAFIPLFRPGLRDQMSRIVHGVLAGVAATFAMTAAMRRLHSNLPADQRYAVPPREIVHALADDGSATSGVRQDEDARSAWTMLAHFAYGGATGALFALQGNRAIATGAGYGVGVWAASYLGWIPAARILVPATRHPMERNLMMLAAHAVWGAVLAAGLREIEEAESDSSRHRGEALRDISPRKQPERT